MGAVSSSSFNRGVSSSAVDFPFLMQRNWNFSSCREGPGEEISI